MTSISSLFSDKASSAEQGGVFGIPANATKWRLMSCAISADLNALDLARLNHFAEIAAESGRVPLGFGPIN
jgi:hypothetical protein